MYSLQTFKITFSPSFLQVISDSSNQAASQSFSLSEHHKLNLSRTNATLQPAVHGVVTSQWKIISNKCNIWMKFPPQQPSEHKLLY